MVLCRLCYLEINDELYKNIFDDKLEPPIWKIVYELANLNILETDPYTKFVCFECFDQLLKFYIFRKTVLENDQKFKQNNQQQFKITTNENCNNNNKDEPCIKMEIEDEDYDLIDEKVDVKEYQVNIDEDFLESVNTNDSGTDIDDKSTIRKIQIPNMIDNNMDDNNRNEVDCLSNGEIDESTTDDSLLPNKSRNSYEKKYRSFKDWCNKNKHNDITENVLLEYFEYQRKKYKPSTLWTTYSMLRSCLNLYKNIDISKYKKLQILLKNSSEGYVPKKSKVLEEDDINRFIKQAEDRIYLAMKVVLIMGYSGACRREELTNMSIDDIKYTSKSIIVTIPKKSNNITRAFAITDQSWIDLIKKYANLRPKNSKHKRFFLTYRNGNCVNSPIGINVMGKMSKFIATYLNLPNPELFTGHCFRRSSALAANRCSDLSLTTRNFIECRSIMDGRFVKSTIQTSMIKHNDRDSPGCSTQAAQL